MTNLIAAGLMTALSYEEVGGYRMTTDEQAAAIALETELLADAKAGVDLRIRLVAAAVSPASPSAE